MKAQLTAALLLCLALAACNTTAGFGRDVEATGEAIEEAADEVKDKMSGNDE